MKTAALLLFLTFACLSSAQYTFTRAELIAAADSALKGQASTIAERQLRAAVHALLRESAARSRESAYCDSLSTAQAETIAAGDERVERMEYAAQQNARRVDRLKPWATVGKVATFVVAGAAVVVGAVFIKREFE